MSLRDFDLRFSGTKILFLEQIEYKILTVASGGQFDTLASQLAAHFKAGGAPAMVGSFLLFLWASPQF